MPFTFAKNESKSALLTGQGKRCSLSSIHDVADGLKRYADDRPVDRGNWEKLVQEVHIVVLNEDLKTEVVQAIQMIFSGLKEYNTTYSSTIKQSQTSKERTNQQDYKNIQKRTGNLSLADRSQVTNENNGNRPKLKKRDFQQQGDQYKIKGNGPFVTKIPILHESHLQSFESQVCHQRCSSIPETEPEPDYHWSQEQYKSGEACGCSSIPETEPEPDHHWSQEQYKSGEACGCSSIPETEPEPDHHWSQEQYKSGEACGCSSIPETEPEPDYHWSQEQYKSGEACGVSGISLTKRSVGVPSQVSGKEGELKISETSKGKAEDVCPICMDKMTDPKELCKCHHVFCRACIDTSFKMFKPVCPSCQTAYGKIIGNMPKTGEMDVQLVKFSGLPGYERYNTIIIHYHFPDGIQTSEHPNPGVPYRGTSRTAYLPGNSEGLKVLKLLEVAWDRRLTFTVGRSTTTGRDNVVTWNDIHHKTSITGGESHFGYPDDTYLSRVTEELASKGVTEADLDYFQ